MAREFLEASEIYGCTLRHAPQEPTTSIPGVQSSGLAVSGYCAGSYWEGLSPVFLFSPFSRNGDGNIKEIGARIASTTMVFFARWMGECLKLETSTRNDSFDITFIGPLPMGIRRFLTVFGLSSRNESPATLAFICTSPWVIGGILTARATQILLEIELSVVGRDS